MIVFLGLIGLLVLFWFANGGKVSIKNMAGQHFTVQSPLSSTTPRNWLPFLTPTSQGGRGVGSAGAGSSQTTGNTSGELISISADGVHASDPSQEYITLYASGTNISPIMISGMQLHSARTGNSVTIGEGTTYAQTGQAASQGPISLAPGQSAIITTGRSPIGVSFRENKCSAYLAQFQTFTPSLSQNCPLPQQELASQPSLAGNSQCSYAVSQIAPCQSVISVPNAPAGCSQFITQRFTYNGCVSAHQSDSNFLSSQWRVYLGLSQELWNNAGDSIILTDSSGKVITGVNY